MRPRQIQTLVGVVHWQRRVGRCPLGCRESQVIPLDNALGIQLNAQTIWSWVQLWGKQAINQLQEEMAQMASGQEPTPEAMSSTLRQMPLVIGADGVMVPMRPHEGQPHGSIQWREVKVGILVRLGHHLNRKGREIVRLHQRRLVAVLGDIDALPWVSA